MFAFGQLVFDVIGVIAGVGFHAMAGGIELQDGCDGVIEEGTVMRDDQGSPAEAIQPVFQPFEHGNVEMVGGFIQQQQVRVRQQQAGQRQARLLAAAELADRGVEGQLCQAERCQDGFGLQPVFRQALEAAS